jgi:uncharacterized protein YfaS (alpha-2-macroglobulin family)
MSAMTAPLARIRTLSFAAAALVGAFVAIPLPAAALEIQRQDVRADRDHPQICWHFDEALPTRGDQRIADYVRVQPAGDMPVSVSGKTVCVGGVRHGETYRIEIRAGLRSTAGTALAADEVVTVSVPERPVSLRFAGSAYVLPLAGSKGVPLKTVNVGQVGVEVYRIDDRGLVTQLNEARLAGDPGWYGRRQIQRQDGALVWQGTMDVAGPRNRETTTLFPIAEALRPATSGLYLLTARVGDAVAAQWVVASDIGLSTFTGDDGMMVAARSLETAKPLAGVRLELLSRDNAVLAEAVTDGDGTAAFPPGFLRGRGGKQAVAVTAARLATAPDAAPPGSIARSPERRLADYTYLDITGPAFDLSDRGVEGRAPPGPVDGYLYLDRGIYRPGERVNAMALIRDSRGDAVVDLPITLRLYRPDGSEARRFVRPSGPAGAIEIPLDFAETDATGRWTLAAHVDVEKSAVAEVDFQLADFVAPKVALALDTDQQALSAGIAAVVTARADFLYGAPASGLKGEFALTWERRRTAFPDFPGYRFGLEDEARVPVHQDGALTPTDGDGLSRLEFTPPPLTGTSHPLEARLRVTVFEDGDRPVNRRITLPYHRSAAMLGIRAGFGDGRVRIGQPAALAVIAVDPATGRQVAHAGAKWELFEEAYDYFWYQEYGQWKWRTTMSDRAIRGGALALGEDAPASLSFDLDWGHYRLEVFDPASGEATSQRFAVGWSSSVTAAADAAPDKLEVTLDRATYRPGDTATVRMDAPFDGEALVTVLGAGVERVIQAPVRRAGAEIAVPVGDWGIGAYVTVSAFRPAPADGARGPSRAIGLAWLGLDQADRRLAVSIDAPEIVRPRQALDVAVSVSGAVGSAHVTLAAVDEAVLRLTNFGSPDPTAHFLAKRRLAVGLRDLYGRLLDGRAGEAGAIRSGGGSAAAHLGGLGARSSKVVALFSGLVALDADGRATIALDLPDFNGRLRLMAVAFDARSTGAAEADLIVRDPVVAELSLPRFLAPGDMADATLSLDVPDQDARGPLTVSLIADGPVMAEGAEDLTLDPTQGRLTRALRLRAVEAGVARLTLTVTGKDGLNLRRDWQLAVRPAEPFSYQRRRRELAPGDRLILSDALLDGYHGAGARVALSVGNRLGLDIDSLARDLARYPYGCLEQTVSKTLPLLVFGDGAGISDSAGRPVDAGARVDGAIRRVLSLQRADGAFGLWSFGSQPEPWLTAYAVEFLTRARDAGHAVDGFALRNAVRWLAGAVRSLSDAPPWRWDAAAYALYVLSLHGGANVGDLRYFADNFTGQLSSPLARAHLAAALARFGETRRARLLAEAAIAELLARPADRSAWRDADFANYGSPLRDSAATLAMAMAAGVPDGPASPLVERVSLLWSRAAHPSTQGKAWMLLANEALAQAGTGDLVAIDGVERRIEEPLTVTVAPDRLRAGLPVVNRGDAPLAYALTISGYPSRPQPAASDGFTLSRRFLDMDGTPVDPTRSGRGDLVVVVIEGALTDTADRWRQSLIVQLLPAGFEIETAEFGDGVAVGDGEGLGALTPLVHRELRVDRFVAQLDLSPGRGAFRTAFVMRAVTPGRFAMPGARIEDMYEPAVHGRTEPLTVSVLADR